VREQCFFLFHGTGANGTSTLVGALMNLLDAYALQIAAETCSGTGQLRAV